MRHFGFWILDFGLRGTLALSVGLAASAGCNRGEPTDAKGPSSEAVASADGQPATAPCPRLVSAAPNVTEICAALELTPCLVGRTRYCTYPPEVLDVPSIGALNDLNAETLLGLRPQLVLVAGTSRQTSERLERLGLRYESLPDVSLADLFTSVARVGALTGRAQAAARLEATIRAELDAAAAKCAGGPKQRVLLLTAPLPDPPTQVDAAGPGSFYDDLLRLAGQTNVAAAGGRAFAPLSLEFVLRADPDVIIELSPDGAGRGGGDADAVRAWSRIGPLRAVAKGRVHVLVGPEHFVLGPRIAQTFAALCTKLAGEPAARVEGGREKGG